MERFFLICLAGALGTGARYLLSVWAEERFGPLFPYGTLIVNLVGCFLMGLVMQLALYVSALSPNARLVLSVGFLGGLTTYSSFNYETTKLFRDGAFALVALNVGLTTAGGFVAGLAGLALGRQLGH